MTTPLACKFLRDHNLEPDRNAVERSFAANSFAVRRQPTRSPLA